MTKEVSSLASSLITPNMNSQSLALCMQPPDITNDDMTHLWGSEPNNTGRPFHMKDTCELKGDVSITVPETNKQTTAIVSPSAYFQDTKHPLDNASAISSSCSPKTVNYADNTRQNATPHVSPNGFLPLYDNALFAPPKMENNVFISATHSSHHQNDLGGIYDAFHYNDIGLDMTTGSDVYSNNNYTNQWIKGMLDNQGFLTSI